jgi:DNA-3-methyladenine glycosylase
MSKILPKKFYQKNTLKVAQSLLGCFLVRKIGNKIIKGMISETEAYIGEDDLACHASKGRTPRTEIMYGEAGRAYVYLIYGMYHCLNIVTEKKNFPAAVLVRRIKIEGVDYKKTNGPGKLCKFLKIDRKLNGWDMTKKDKLWIEKPVQNPSAADIVADKRIGIDYAKHCRHYLWRFYLKEEK